MKLENRIRPVLQCFFVITAFWLAAGVGLAGTNAVSIASVPLASPLVKTGSEEQKDIKPPEPVISEAEQFTQFLALKSDGLKCQPVLQQNFSKFVPVKFQKDTNGEVVFHQLRVSQNLLEFGDKRYYCGFQFTAPDWMDGDIHWTFLLNKTEKQKNHPSPEDVIA